MLRTASVGFRGMWSVGQRGSVEQTVTVTGALQPVKTIEVGSQLSGQLSKVYVDFNDTVRNNIAYGRPDVPQEKVIQAAQAALAHDFITRLPEGYDTVIGDGGRALQRRADPADR